MLHIENKLKEQLANRLETYNNLCSQIKVLKKQQGIIQKEIQEETNNDIPLIETELGLVRGKKYEIIVKDKYRIFYKKEIIAYYGGMRAKIITSAHSINYVFKLTLYKLKKDGSESLREFPPYDIPTLDEVKEIRPLEY